MDHYYYHGVPSQHQSAHMSIVRENLVIITSSAATEGLIDLTSLYWNQMETQTDTDRIKVLFVTYTFRTFQTNQSLTQTELGLQSSFK